LDGDEMSAQEIVGVGKKNTIGNFVFSKMHI